MSVSIKKLKGFLFWMVFTGILFSNHSYSYNYEVELVPKSNIFALLTANEYTDFDKAILTGKEMVSNYPNSPEGYILLTFVYTTFMNNYKTKVYDDEFYDMYKASKDILELILESDPKNTKAKFFFGVITSYFGIMQLRNDHFFSALRYGLKGMSYLKDTIDLEKVKEPMYDSYFGLSQFYYYRARFSKMFSWIPGVKDDVDRSYEFLELSKSNGFYMKSESVLSEFTMRISDNRVTDEMVDTLFTLRETHTNHIFLDNKMVDYYLLKQDYSNSLKYSFDVLDKINKEELSGFGAYLQIYYKIALSYYYLDDFHTSSVYLNNIKEKMLVYEDWYQNDYYLKAYRKLFRKVEAKMVNSEDKSDLSEQDD